MGLALFLVLLFPPFVLGQAKLLPVEVNATEVVEELVPVLPEEGALTPFEKAELRRLLNLDVGDLSRQPLRGVLGYEQKYWRNPASVHVVRPDDLRLNGHLLTVEALRGVPGMHVSRGLAYDNFATMRNFSGLSTEKFLGLIDGREVTQLMLGSANWSVDDVPLAILDRLEIIRGPGASIWGTNAVNGVVNGVTKHTADTQGDSVRLVFADNGSFLGDYVHGGQVSEDSYYRVWVRDQEYAEGTLNSGLPARDDGHLRKAGFRYDTELGADMTLLISGGYATRRLEHVLDLSNRLFYVPDLTNPVPVPLSYAQQLAALPPLHPLYIDPANLPPSGSYHSFWASPNGFVPYPELPVGQIARYENYEKMTNDSAHVQAKLDGVTDGNLEWSLIGYADYSDILLGHIGSRWEQRQYDLSFQANRPIGDRNHLAFGLSARRTTLDVSSKVTEPFNFPALLDPLNPFSASDQIPVFDYDQSATEFDRANAFLQDTIEVDDRTLFSFGAKFEENDLSGFGIQPGARVSWAANESNVLWAAYAKAHRQPSLRERYTTLSPIRFWVPTLPAPPYSTKWVNQSYSGDASLDREEMDAYEVGWRFRPRENLIFELSSYYYDTKNAVRASTDPFAINAYEAQDAEAYGGEISIDYRPTDLWRLRAGYSLSEGKVAGTKMEDFPEVLANLSSHLRVRDDLTFSQNLYYSDSIKIPSDYNPITIPSHLRLDLGLIWQPGEEWEVGLFGRDLLESHHVETMYPGIDVEPARVERTFLLSITKRF